MPLGPGRADRVEAAGRAKDRDSALAQDGLVTVRGCSLCAASFRSCVSTKATGGYYSVVEYMLRDNVPFLTDTPPPVIA